jgi:hypothetical protein
MSFGRIRGGLITVATLVASVSSSVGQSKSQTHRLSYQPAVVTLEGTLVRRTFPGPPNYESIRKGDRPETAWILELGAPVCVYPDSAEPDINPGVDGVRSVQLVFSGQVEIQEHHQLWGKEVIVKGTPYGVHTGHHHTPVLLTMESIEKAPALAPLKN